MSNSKSLLFWIFCCLFFVLPAWGQQEATTSTGEKVWLFPDGTWVFVTDTSTAVQSEVLQNLEWPAFSSTDPVVSHTAFTLLYAEPHEQASWVAYYLTRTRTQKLFDRTDNFRVDPKVLTGSATHADYAGSGYDRGHLAPAADMSWSFDALSESFYYSNMSPQLPGFNRGVWKRLEELVRNWANEYDTLYVVTGPLLSSNLPKIGPNGVSVPAFYYKAVLRYGSAGNQGIAFMLPNNSSNAHLQTFAISIDSLERVSGINFFHQLPDDVETVIERQMCISCWNWQAQKLSNEKPASSGASTQCLGTTKAGNRCKSRTTHASGFCHAHLNQFQGSSTITQELQQPASEKKATTTQCSGTTKAGNRCKRMTRNANGRCFQHGGA